MHENVSEQRQHVHAFVDRLPEEKLATVHGLLESMLSPLDRALALAPIDDEPLTDEDIAAMKAGEASLDAGLGIPMEDILREFGITPEELQSSGSSHQHGG
jgi:hypothetical protein